VSEIVGNYIHTGAVLSEYIQEKWEEEENELLLHSAAIIHSAVCLNTGI
jgi:hypothetical protein